MELDGWRFHETARQRDRDLDRDLLARIQHGGGDDPAGVGAVCRATGGPAGMIGSAAGPGWVGEVQPCRPGCEAPQVFVRAAA